MKLKDLAWDSDTFYPVLFLPKSCTSLGKSCEIFDDMFLVLTVKTEDLSEEESLVYAGYCNVKLVERCEFDSPDLRPALTPDPKSLDHVEVLGDQASHNQSFYPYTQSQVWIDPQRSPFIRNGWKAPGAQRIVSISQLNQPNGLIVNRGNTFILQNVFNSVLYDEIGNSDYMQVAPESEVVYQSGSDEMEMNNSYENDEFEYNFLLSQQPEEKINDNRVPDTAEMNQTESLNENDALKQLMSPRIQSKSKQQKTILFLSDKRPHGQTVQKIAVNDPSVECLETEKEQGRTIDKKKTSTQKKYQCEKCNQMFDQLATFKQHVVIHKNKAVQSIVEDKDNLTCTICNKKMKTREKYELHCAGHGNPDLECETCSKVFASKSSLRTHRQLHMRKYPCDLCTKTFSKKTEFKAHFAKAHSVYKCDTCNYTTHNQKEFQTHQDTHAECGESEDEEPAVIPMEITNYELIESYETKQNKTPKSQKKTRMNNAEDDQVLNADEVIAKVMSNKIFLLHSKAAKKGKKFNKSCDVCSKSFERIGDLKRHLIEHVVNSTLAKNPVDKNGTLYINCEVCGKQSFSKTDKYKEHLREHAKLTLYRCIICNKSFSDSSNFSKHKKIHGSSYYQCDLCQRKFNSKKMLTQHMEYHRKNSPMECTYCDKVFYFESMLNKHIKCMHIKEASARFRCRFCHQYYKTLKEKWDHEWYVHKVRKVVADCYYCDAKFRKYAELKRHSTAVHNKSIPNAKRMAELRVRNKTSPC